MRFLLVAATELRARAARQPDSRRRLSLLRAAARLHARIASRGYPDDGHRHDRDGRLVRARAGAAAVRRSRSTSACAAASIRRIRRAPSSTSMTDCIPELGAEDDEQFLTVQQLGLLGPDDPPFRGGKLVNPEVPPNRVIAGLRVVSGITVNTVHGNVRSIARVVERFAPDVESMEGAAFMYACLVSGARFAQVRAVSNMVEKRNRGAWKLGRGDRRAQRRRPPPDRTRHDADARLLAVSERLLHVRCDGARPHRYRGARRSTSACSTSTP